MTWGLGTLMPVIGIILLCVTQLTTDLEFAPSALAWAILLLSIMAIGQAFALSMLTASQISDPIRQLRRAIERAQRGETDVRVEVFDGSEIGRLQVGFNRMMREADERRLLRELFGQHVGEDVARRALQFGTELGGETRFVAVLFVDMVGSTGAAAERPPSEVVELLNEFFRVVVDVVDRHHGFVTSSWAMRRSRSSAPRSTGPTHPPRRSPRPASCGSRSTRSPASTSVSACPRDWRSRATSVRPSVSSTP